MTIYEKLKQMSKEELAEWIFANAEWISAEYGACSGADDSGDVLRLLESDAGGDW